MTSPAAPRVPDLLVVQPRWVTLEGEFTDPEAAEPRPLRAVTLLDEAVALGAPFEEFPLQVGLGVHLQEVDDTGQPTPAEKAVLREFQTAVVQALGDQGRVVAALTVDGVREYVAYLRSTDVLVPWQDAPPAGMDTRDWQVQVLEDPTWLGLREIAGLLQPGEETLGPLPEVQGPADGPEAGGPGAPA
ncbi:MAG: hypothetical protein JWO60_2444 [Frankiales bacterium]|nr:hypothetical protein [Frankiales bacterium]